ncbi:hypothetical protein D3C80_1350320 [compost metagenome]
MGPFKLPTIELMASIIPNVIEPSITSFADKKVIKIFFNSFITDDPIVCDCSKTRPFIETLNNLA